MKSSFYQCLAVLAATVLIVGCEDGGGGFSGVNLPGGAPGGGGGAGGGGGGGGGGGNTIEPRLVRQVEAGGSVFDIEIGGNEQLIVFASDENPTGANPNGALQIFSADVGSGGVAQVTTTPSPNALTLAQFDINSGGSLVLFASREDLTGDNPTLSHNLFIASNTGQTVTQVTRNMSVGEFIEWQLSGAGDFVVFSTFMDLLGTNATNDGQLYRIDADGNNLTQITFDDTFPFSIRLAEGSNRIAYLAIEDPVGDNPDGNRELFAINADGSSHLQLTDTVGSLTLSSPEISDNGASIAFVSERDLTMNNADLQLEVFIAQSDGSGINQVTNSDQPSGTFISGIAGDIDISGNGNYIVFGSSFNFTGENPNNEHTIYWATADGSQVGQPLRDGTVRDTAQSFLAENVSMSDDGSAILFVTFENMSFDSSGTGVKIYTTGRQ